MQSPFTLVAVFLLAIVHLVAGKLRFISIVPRSIWLSISGGASVAYVFVHLLPELHAGQELFSQAAVGWLPFVEHHVYLVALAGLVAFYGLERMVVESRKSSESVGSTAPNAGVFWLHISSFAIYNALIGYLLLHRIQPGLQSLVFFVLAMMLHFLVNDFGLRAHHQERYTLAGRWVLAGAVLIGWITGAMTEIHELALAVLVAFLSGGIILNVLKEELPEERASRFWAFAVGAVGYTILLLAT